MVISGLSQTVWEDEYTDILALTWNGSIRRGSRQTFVMECSHTEALVGSRTADQTLQATVAAIQFLLGEI